MNPNPYTMTTTEAAVLFRVGRRTIVEYCARGQLDAIKAKSGANDVWMINPAGALRSKPEPMWGVWCPKCEGFFPVDIGNVQYQCPRCGGVSTHYGPVEVEPDDLA